MKYWYLALLSLALVTLYIIRAVFFRHTLSYVLLVGNLLCAFFWPIIGAYIYFKLKAAKDRESRRDNMILKRLSDLEEIDEIL